MKTVIIDRVITAVFDTGIPRAGLCHTVTEPLNTVPIQGTGRNRPLIYMVSYKTRGITFTRGILIIKFVKLISTILIHM